MTQKPAPEPDAPAPVKPKRRLVMLAILGAPVFLVGASLGFVVLKVEKVHTLWCGKIGLLCVKEEPKPKVVLPPAGCPDFKMVGVLRAREPDDHAAWSVEADVKGKVALKHGMEAASGTSSVACFKGAFLASFTDMSDEVTTQCMGTIDGKTYLGVCSRSVVGSRDIEGEFTR